MFSSLNFAEDHPARQRDTFFIRATRYRSAYTSSVQTASWKDDPPIRIICPGRVYRRKRLYGTPAASSWRRYVDKDVSFADLKQPCFSSPGDVWCPYKDSSPPVLLSVLNRARRWISAACVAEKVAHSASTPVGRAGCHGGPQCVEKCGAQQNLFRIRTRNGYQRIPT